MERDERIEELKGYVEEVWALAEGEPEEVEAVKPTWAHKPGEVAIVFRYRDHTDTWRMTFCEKPGCDCGLYDGWRLDKSEKLS